uniref:Uncharacterized protein n=1 Tax=Rhizophora mucronata TaxID=61149 RepID=A0A2P2JJM1_RHIMU
MIWGAIIMIMELCSFHAVRVCLEKDLEQPIKCPLVGTPQKGSITMWFSLNALFL